MIKLILEVKIDNNGSNKNTLIIAVDTLKSVEASKKSKDEKCVPLNINFKRKRVYLKSFRAIFRLPYLILPPRVVPTTCHRFRIISVILFWDGSKTGRK